MDTSTGSDFAYSIDLKKQTVTIIRQNVPVSEALDTLMDDDTNKNDAHVDSQQVSDDSPKIPNKIVHQDDSDQPSHSTSNNNETLPETSIKKKKPGRKKKESQEDGGKPPTYNCKICNKSFKTKSGAKGHEKHHQVDPKLFCLVCKKSFKFSYDLDRHMKTHTGHRPYQCADCEKSFVCKSSLMQHVRQKHIVGNIYMCSVCARSFCTETDLKRHSAVHTEDKPFKCEKCLKTFTCKSSLKAHQRNHGEKKFACSFCNMHFHLQSDLSRHETIHTGARPWQCKLCEKGYSCKSALKVHLKHVHKTIPTPDLYVQVKENVTQSENLNESEKIRNTDDDTDSDTDNYGKHAVNNDYNNKAEGRYTLNMYEEYEDFDSSDEDEAIDIDDSDETDLNNDSHDEMQLKDFNDLTSRRKSEMLNHKTAHVRPQLDDKVVGMNPQTSNKKTKTNIDRIEDPYKTIDEMNKDLQSEQRVNIHPMSKHKPGKSQRKAKFVQKLEVSGDCMLVYKS